jgi:molybdopterin biosynthesis enzyme MoaB
VNARVIVASNRAAAGVYSDETGPLLVQALTDWGFTTSPAIVVPDGDPVTDALRDAVIEGVAVVLSSGG